MFERLDIALPFDREWTDDAGKRRTADRSKHGLHALVGNGSTSNTYPTWDASRGMYIFGSVNHSIQIDHTEDVDNILANMGSIQDETYLIHFSPLKASVAQNVWFDKREGSDRLTLSTDDQFRFQLAFIGSAGSEIVKSAINEVLKYEGRDIIAAWVRKLNSQEFFVDGNLIATGTSTSRDVSNTGRVWMGRSAPGTPLVTGTGFRFVGYARTALTGAQQRIIKQYFKEML